MSLETNVTLVSGLSERRTRRVGPRSPLRVFHRVASAVSIFGGSWKVNTIRAFSPSRTVFASGSHPFSSCPMILKDATSVVVASTDRQQMSRSSRMVATTRSPGRTSPRTSPGAARSESLA